MADQLADGIYPQHVAYDHLDYGLEHHHIVADLCDDDLHDRLQHHDHLQHCLDDFVEHLEADLPEHQHHLVNLVEHHDHDQYVKANVSGHLAGHNDDLGHQQSH